MTTHTRVPVFRPALVLALLAGLSACSPASTSDTGAAARDQEEQASPAATEEAGPRPRLALTYDGGVMVLDAGSLEVVGDVPLDGFSRIAPAGDGRHVAVAVGDGFRFLDAGTWTQAHGDHGHSFTAAPSLTDLEVEAPHPGHVVPSEGGDTLLWSDGTGEVTRFDPTRLTDWARDGGHVEGTTWTAGAAHHGVAVLTDPTTMVTTHGTEDARDGALVIDTRSGDVLAQDDSCPGVHGETHLSGGRLLLGCEDGGVLVVDGTTITRLDSDDPRGRIGNVRGDAASPLVFGDLTLPDEGEDDARRVTVTDADAGTVRVSDPVADYTFRGLERNATEGFVLGEDGAVHVIDLATGKETRAVPVIGAWQEPEEWQQPQPALFALGDTLFVTEPDGAEGPTLHALDRETLEPLSRAGLPHVPNEITGVSGADETAPAHEGHEGHEGHDH